MAENKFKFEGLLGIAGGSRERLKAGLSQAPINTAKGFCMGSADIIPGVSGGTMALILGIYERLLKAIRSFDKDWIADVLHLRFTAALSRNDLLFLFPLGFGIIAAILFFTRVVPLPTLILTHPELVYGLFFGLIVASVVILLGEVDRYGFREFLVTAVGIAVGFAVVTLVPVDTPTASWFIFLCGFVAISAMLLPGISGSFILLILGKYAYIINALGTFDLAVIVAFCAGALSGLIVFSRAIVWLLDRYHKTTLLVIKGILIGSLWLIWPFQDRVYETIRGKQKMVSASPVWPDVLDGTVVASVLLMLAGFILVMIIHRLAVRHETA
jgi:putative membrane protein